MNNWMYQGNCFNHAAEKAEEKKPIMAADGPKFELHINRRPDMMPTAIDPKTLVKMDVILSNWESGGRKWSRLMAHYGGWVVALMFIALWVMVGFSIFLLPLKVL
jgi:hypothetical protein